MPQKTTPITKNIMFTKTKAKLTLLKCKMLYLIKVNTRAKTKRINRIKITIRADSYELIKISPVQKVLKSMNKEIIS